MPIIGKHSIRQNILLFLGSLFFYGFANMKMLILLLVSIIVVWSLSKCVSQNKKCNDIKKAKLHLVVGILFSVGILFYFKYFNFFIDSFCEILALFGMTESYSILNIIVPLGISFYTFKLISYLIDVYKGNIGYDVDLLFFAIYISYFPAIMSGPIDRPKHFISQLKVSRVFDYDCAVNGCRQILWGLFKKMVVADNISNLLSTDIHSLPGSSLLIFAFFYSIQIYADFSGYSDMAIGVGKMLNLKSMANFKTPYFSRNISEFWKRWHISLTSWFTEYLYFNLGGNRCAKWRHLTNIMIVFLVSGLWHGSNWNFILWGAFHGILMVICVLLHSPKYKDVVAEGSSFPSVKDIFQMLSAFVLASLGWILFKYENFSDLSFYFGKMCSMSLFEKPSHTLPLYFPFIFIFIMFVCEWCSRTGEDYTFLNKINAQSVRYTVYIVLILLILFYQGVSSDFIYFKF